MNVAAPIAHRSGGGAAGNAGVTEVPLYAKREHIYQRETKGPWQRLRTVVLALLTGVFLLIPWLTWDGRQAVLFDLPARKFYLFGLTFWPQDFIYLSGLLILAAYSLFFFTAVAGRLWCGYACPQTVWTKFFMWIEYLTEGDRNARILLDRAPWSRRKVLRKAAKHAMWLALACVVGTTFVGYFLPLRDLVVRIATLDIGSGEAVFLAIASLALYADAGWMREQICKYACPYARFQGAMFDTATWTIFYDPARGEPRGHRSRSTDPRAAGLGDCVDCKLCVYVCPTGIDIRQGTQYECIGCAACIDACNGVMAEMGYARGLVRYATEESLRGVRTRLLRPRVLAYGAMLVVLTSTLAYALAVRLPLDVDVLRDRARLYREVGADGIENVYTLKIMNKDQRPHTYRLSAHADFPVELAAPAEVVAYSGELVEVPVRLQASRAHLPSPKTEVEFEVRSSNGHDVVVRKTTSFLGPRPSPGTKDTE